MEKVKIFFVTLIVTTLLGSSLFWVTDNGDLKLTPAFVAGVAALSFGLPNAVFVTVMSIEKFRMNFFASNVFILLESILLYAIYFCIDRVLIPMLPTSFKYDSSPEVSSQRIFFSFQFEMLYSFIAVFLLFFFLRNFLNTKLQR
jgi:hypothetical protein